MVYVQSQPNLKKSSDKVVLEMRTVMNDVSDILGTYSDKEYRKPEQDDRDDSHNSPSDPCDPFDQFEDQMLEHVKDLFLLIKSSLFEEDDSIYESYWRRVFERYYSDY